MIPNFVDKIKTLELNDKGLRSQISELVAEKEKCEEQIDELSEELESRIKQLTVRYLFLFINNKNVKQLYFSIIQIKISEHIINKRRRNNKI